MYYSKHVDENQIQDGKLIVWEDSNPCTTLVTSGVLWKTKHNAEQTVRNCLKIFSTDMGIFSLGIKKLIRAEAKSGNGIGSNWSKVLQWRVVSTTEVAGRLNFVTIGKVVSF